MNTIIFLLKQKNREYDWLSNHDYYFGELALFDFSLAEEEKIGKSLYVIMDQENKNYVFIGVYEGSEITALNPDINYYYDTKNYHECNGQYKCYKFIEEFTIVDKENTPDFDDWFYIKHNSASDTPIYGGTIDLYENGNYYELVRGKSVAVQIEKSIQESNP